MAGIVRKPERVAGEHLSAEANLFASLVSIAANQDSPEAALQQCLRAVCEYVGWPVGHLYVDAADGSGELVPTEAWYLDDPDGFVEFRNITSRTRFASGVGLPGRVLSLGEPVWIPDVQKDTNFPRNREAADIGVRAAFGVPVETAGRVVAVLEFFAAEALEPDEHILQVVQVLGDQIGQILERQRTGEQLLSARKDVEVEIRAQLAEELRVGETLAEIGRIVTSSPDIESIYASFSEQVRQLIPFDRIVITTADEDRGTVIERYVAGDSLSNAATGRQYPLAGSSTEERLKDDGPTLFAGDSLRELAGHHPELQERIESGLLSMLTAPLVWEDRTVGTITLRGRDPQGYGDRELELIGRIAAQISGAIANAELNEQLRREAEERRLIAEIGSLLTTPDLSPVWSHLAGLIDELIPHDRIILTTFDLDRGLGTNRYVGGFEVPQGESGRTYPIPSSTPTGALPRLDFIEPKILTGESHLEYVRQYPDWQKSLDAGLLSVMGTTLVWEGQPVGFMTLRALDPDAFGPPELDRLSRISRQIAGAMANAVLTESLEAQAAQQEALAEIGRVVNSNLDVDAVYAAVADALKPLILYDRLSISLLMPDGQLQRAFVQGIEMEGAVGETFTIDIDRRDDGTRLLHHSLQTPLEESFVAAGLISWAEVPLGPVDSPIGYLSARSTEAKAYTELDIDLMKQVSAQITPAIENARLIARLEYQALSDSATSLLNRAGFESAIDSALESGTESAGTVMAIIIEGIRELEDRFGVVFAERVLAELGKRLGDEYGDRGTVGRIGHDEFGIGLLAREDAIGWSGIAGDIIASCTKPFEIDGELIGLDISVGVSLYPGHGSTAEDLTRRAVLATRSTGQSTDRSSLFNSAMEESTSDHVRVLTAFRQGMADQEVILHYQPKVDISTGQIVGAEALVRWQSPERGTVSPSVFIPVLESSGYMWEFTCWTVAEALEQIRVWSDASQNEAWDPVQIAVNVSARDFQDRRLPAQIMSNLELWGVDPALVEIEVPETAMMVDPDAAIEVCRELKQMGLSIAIDDFGVGQSPLVYLDRLDVDLIKIDRAFITDIDQSESRQAIVGAMVGLGSQLGIKVLAEGVETEEEAAVIRATGCHYGQGYLWARPMPAGELEQILQDGLITAR